MEQETNQSGNGLSTAGLVLGIIAICFYFIPFINFLSIILGLLAAIFGFIGVIKNKKKGMAIAALVLGILSIVFTVNYYKNVSDTINDVFGGSESSITTNDSKKEEKIAINIGDVVTGKDWEISIDSVQFSQDVEPPKKNMFYTHYQVKDTDNTYLYLVLNCKNISSVALGADKVANMTVKCNNNYTYSSFDTMPDDTTGFTYTNITNIKPLTTKQIYYLAEMPKSFENGNEPIEVQLKFEGKTYICQYR